MCRAGSLQGYTCVTADRPLPLKSGHFLTEPVGVGAAVTYMKSMLQFQVWVKKQSLWVAGGVSQIKLLTDWKVTEEVSISGEKARSVRNEEARSIHGEEMKSGLGTLFPADCRRRAWGDPRGLLASTQGQPATLLPVAVPTPPTLPTPAHSSPHPTPPRLPLIQPPSAHPSLLDPPTCQDPRAGPSLCTALGPGMSGGPGPPLQAAPSLTCVPCGAPGNPDPSLSPSRGGSSTPVSPAEDPTLPLGAQPLLTLLLTVTLKSGDSCPMTLPLPAPWCHQTSR